MIGEISASRIPHTENAWLFSRATEPRRLVGDTACEIIGSREYEAYEIVKLVDWLADRLAGYPSLRKFEGGANHPTETPEPRSVDAGALWERSYGWARPRRVFAKAPTD